MSTQHACSQCGAPCKQRTGTFPLRLRDKTHYVKNIAMWECPRCGHLVPTDEDNKEVTMYMLEHGLLLAGGNISKKYTRH